MLTPMPYIRAEMGYQRQGHHFEFKVRQPSSSRSLLSVTYRPKPAQTIAAEGTLDAWLLERYRLFIVDRPQQLFQSIVAHPPWVIQDADVTIAENNIGEQVGLESLGSPAKVHFSRGVGAKFGAFRMVEKLPRRITDCRPDFWYSGVGKGKNGE
jgi:uncharacterized protein YqjF (DUF2071 family)